MQLVGMGLTGRPDNDNISRLMASAPLQRRPRSVLALLHLLLRPQHLEGASQVLLHPHHGPAVVELPAVVGGREESHQLLLGEELVPVLHHLVRPADQVQLVLAQEVEDHLLPEHVAHSPLRLPPHLRRRLRVGPQQVAQQPRVGDIGRSCDRVDLVDGHEVRREAAVHAQHFLLYESCGGHAVKAVDEALPQPYAIPGLAQIISSVHSSKKPQMRVMAADSWLPRRMCRELGNLILQAKSRLIVSMPCRPRSTQSPRKRYEDYEGRPPYSNSRSMSQNWPWMSPHTFRGAETFRSMGCSIKMLFTMRMRPRICASVRSAKVPGFAERRWSSLSMISSISISIQWLRGSMEGGCYILGSAIGLEVGE